MENAQSFRRRRERILVDDVIIVTDAVLLLLLLGGGGGHASSSRSESAVVRFIRENRNRASLSLFLILERREKPISKISTLFSLSFGENFSLSVRSKRRERSIRDYSLSLSPSSSYFSLSPAIVGRAAERAFSSSSFVNVRRKMKSFLSPCLFFSR